MEFVNAINVVEESSESFSDTSSSAITQHDNPKENVTSDVPAVMGLLGKGKSRIIFGLTLNMARAQILLMKEGGSKLATLSQDNFLTDIKVCCFYHFFSHCDIYHVSVNSQILFSPWPGVSIFFYNKGISWKSEN